MKSKSEAPTNTLAGAGGQQSNETHLEHTTIDGSAQIATYRTGEIALASWLLTLGYRIISANKLTARYVELVFTPAPSPEQLAEFYRGEAMVEVRAICAAMHEVKSALYAITRGER
jgi:hypothetical protein